MRDRSGMGWWRAPIVVAACFGLVGAAPRAAPDLILHNGRITTLDAGDREVEAVAIRDGRILAVGRSRDIVALADRATRRIDLAGRRATPGLIDGHLHGLRLGYHCFSTTVRLDATFTRREALAAYAAKARAVPPGTWIVTHGGWIPEQFGDDGRMFTRAELDRVAPDRPLYVRYLGYDGALVNSAGLRVLGLTPATPGVVTAGGEPTGQLRQPTREATDIERWGFALAGRAIERQYDVQPIEAQARCLADFIAEMNGLGLTAWVDPDGNQQPFNLADGACRSFAVGLHGRQAVGALHRRRQLNARIGYYVTPRVMNGLAAVEGDDRLAMSGTGDDMLRLLGLGEDLFCPGNRPQRAEARFDDVMTLIAANASGLKIHASGLDTQLFYLASWERVNKRYPLAPLRWTIGHPGEDGQIPPESLERMKALGIGIDTSTIASLGSRPSLPFRRLYTSGVRWCMSTDSTAGSSYAPFVKLWYAVSGKTLKPGVPGIAPAERLTRLEALRASTVNCAWHLDQDGRVGSIEPGRHADIIVLDDDYFSVPVDRIRTLRSVLTIVGGRIVHQDRES